MSAWRHPRGPWEQLEGYVGIRNKIFIDLVRAARECPSTLGWAGRRFAPPSRWGGASRRLRAPSAPLRGTMFPSFSLFTNSSFSNSQLSTWSGKSRKYGFACLGDVGDLGLFPCAIRAILACFLRSSRQSGFAFLGLDNLGKRSWIVWAILVHFPKTIWAISASLSWVILGLCVCFSWIMNCIDRLLKTCSVHT